nr:MAG TPA: hypothetical protein [Bacteriophage sp.]
MHKINIWRNVLVFTLSLQTLANTALQRFN